MWKKLLRLRELFGDMEMVELGDRLDEFFDRPRRRAGENLRDYVHRFEVMHLRLSEAGETLSERARVNRLLKGSGLSEREQRELLMSIGGQYDFGKLKVAMALYSSYFSRSSAPPTSFSAGGPRPTPFNSRASPLGKVGAARLTPGRSPSGATTSTRWPAWARSTPARPASTRRTRPMSMRRPTSTAISRKS